jgi:predicted metal-dependent peptidase
VDAKLSDALALARFQASRAVPFLARGLWACTYVASDDVPTFAIDRKWRVLVNPTFAQKSNDAKVLPRRLLHEALHNILRHGRRGDAIGAEGAEWNVCGDCEIEQRIDEVLALAFDVPKGDPLRGVRAEDFGWKPGEPAEAYYRQPPKQDDKGGKRPEDGEGHGKGHECSGGSGAGNPHPAEKALPQEGQDGPQGLSDAEGDLVAASVAAAVRDAAARKPGSVPGGLLRWAETFGDPPPVDWAALVTARVRYAISTRRGPAPSYARQSRRSMGCAMILPVHRSPLPRVALVCDTSGSMGQKDIGTSLATVASACMALGKVTACACDATAGEAVEVRCVDDLEPYFKGGGGTDMVAGIARASEGNPDCIVVCTDGETPWPSEAPACPIVVVLTRDPSFCGRPPAWAEVIQAF